MDILAVKNFRCFSEPGELALKPLTLLVGENSTGKSSFMAAIRLAWDIAFSARRIDFNEEPFLLGAFDQIAHFRGGRGGRAQTFEIGFKARRRPRAPRRDPMQAELPLASAPRSTSFIYRAAEFGKHGSHPVIKKQIIRADEYELTLEFPNDDSQPKLDVRVDEHTVSLQIEDGLFLRSGSDVPVNWMYLLQYLHQEGLARNTGQAFKLDNVQVSVLREFLMGERFRLPKRPVAIAPVRTRPQRTYNPVSETPLPEGEHVPMVLAKTYFENKNQWESLKRSLDQFGSESGLFSSIDIKPLGHESDPFQIRVKLKGPFANLIDVGYGVSQVLPILVDALLADRGNLYLLQQPEVHLHPRAQAALGSFLVRLAGEQSKRFVIETHSDNLIDRIRMDVRDTDVIKPEDVSILYFDRHGIEISIHSMKIDKNGNFVDVPRDYRKFFLAEERRFLGA